VQDKSKTDAAASRIGAILQCSLQAKAGRGGRPAEVLNVTVSDRRAMLAVPLQEARMTCRKFRRAV
jgi:hypothetical protein